MKILLLEDDLILNEIIEEHLIEQNYTVTSVFNGLQAEEMLYANTYDLLILDVNVPNINGFELLKTLRLHHIMTPAIFITSLNRIDDIEQGFESGCDDYIKKPFALKELDLRIMNIRRLFKIESSNCITISNNISIDVNNLCIQSDDTSTNITVKELEVLMYLIKNEENIVSIEQICSNVWSYDESPSNATIRTYIKNIRKILGDDFIVNIRGVGYRFNRK